MFSEFGFGVTELDIHNHLFQPENVLTITMRASWSFTTFLRQSSAHTQRNPNGQIRNLTGETKVGDCSSKGPDRNVMNELPQSKDQNLTDIAREICRITRTKLGWEKTLLSDYPSFNFSDPCFFQEFLKHQSNALLSLRFFNWLCSHCGFLPDQSSFNALLNTLLDAKAINAAKYVLDCTGLTLEPTSLECYIRCLSDGGRVEEALDVFVKLKNVGFCPSVTTWNACIFACLKNGKTDLVWTLYEQMMECGVTEKIDVETVGYIIKAYCQEKEFSKGYELLRQVMEDGFCPDNAVFNTLISGLCEERQHFRVSELLHLMITQKHNPDIFTYQEIINGLSKKRKHHESFRIFNDLKDRGYFPDRVMYTTMIKSFCEKGLYGEARKLWFEMIRKGFLPNEYTYNVMIHGYCKIGKFYKAKKLLKEMCDRGFKETTVSYNTMISGLCLYGEIEEANHLFGEMSQKGIGHDLITYNSLIHGLCKKRKVYEATKVFNELLTQGLEPSTSFTRLVKALCKVGKTQEAIRLWKDMHDRHLEPRISTHHHIIIGLCKQGYLKEGMMWLTEMLNRKLNPSRKTFEGLIQCLSQKDKLDDVLVVLDLMFRTGHTLEKSIIYSLVSKFGKNDENCLNKILQRS
ncbi:hypothetical protein L6164_012563 [Bauhinia variegata]|uniref:Uncharacterized protein n=1 Tax=Bauhinia variegata TaxID=167791 RepID=A0ACB9PAI1_BAUVA|nr:hypothetical protein L6164_012563 [Bauhinia variegata]